MIGTDMPNKAKIQRPLIGDSKICECFYLLPFFIQKNKQVDSPNKTKIFKQLLFHFHG